MTELTANKIAIAIQYNKTAANRVGWEENFGELSRLLSINPTTSSAKKFVKEVNRWQEKNPPLTSDGKLGSGTWRKMKLRMNLSNSRFSALPVWLSPVPTSIGNINFSSPQETACFVITANRLENEFRKFGPPRDSRRSPCSRVGNGKIKNQCAIRMCVALSRAANSDILGGYTGGLVHGTRCCSASPPTRHITGSRELFNHLNDTLNFNFSRYNSGNETISRLAGRKGIIFFKRCFSRDNGTVGSHIDYWNGTTYTNSARGNAAAHEGLGLFNSAQQIYFCILP